MQHVESSRQPAAWGRARSRSRIERGSHLSRSRRVRASGGDDTGDDGGGDEKFAADHWSLRSTEIRYRGRVRAWDAFALDRADTALHDRPSPSAEHQIKLTGLA